MLFALSSTSDKLAVSSSNKAYILDSTFNLVDQVDYESFVRQLAFTNYKLVASLDNKQFEDVSLSKRSTCIINYNKKIIIADKSGDVYAYNDSKLELLLGHYIRVIEIRKYE